MDQKGILALGLGVKNLDIQIRMEPQNLLDQTPMYALLYDKDMLSHLKMSRTHLLFFYRVDNVLEFVQHKIFLNSFQIPIAI